MLTKERMLHIMNILENKGFVSVKELTENFNVSRSSVMRDLIELENQGLIHRERGGASLKSISSTLTSFNETSIVVKEQVNSEAKRLICKEASKSIRDGDCIYIDSGTTPVYLLDYIGTKRIKLVTPSIYLIRKLPNNFKGDIFLLGGEFSKSYDTSYGSLTLEMIRQFHFDHAFFSTNGVNLENGEVYVFDFNVGANKQEIMLRSEVSDLLVDASKFNMKAMSNWANLDQFHTVYVDSIDERIEIPDNFVVCTEKENENE
jgi:DeoR/GlpR family transcriptional regulator of sugar metabolism